MNTTPVHGSAGLRRRILADFAALSNRLGVKPMSFCTMTVDSASIARVVWVDLPTEVESDSEIESKFQRVA